MKISALYSIDIIVSAIARTDFFGVIRGMFPEAVAGFGAQERLRIGLQIVIAADFERRGFFRDELAIGDGAARRAIEDAEMVRQIGGFWTLPAGADRRAEELEQSLLIEIMRNAQRIALAGMGRV